MRRPGCELYLLHVIPETDAQFWKTYVYEVEDVDNKAKRDMDQRIQEAYLSRVPEGVNLKIEYRVGKDWQEILDFAQQDQGGFDRDGAAGQRLAAKGAVWQCYRKSCPQGRMRRAGCAAELSRTYCAAIVSMHDSPSPRGVSILRLMPSENYYTCAVQNAHLLAFIGIFERHCGQSFVVIGAAGRSAFKTIDLLYQQKDRKRHDQKVDQRIDEQAVIKRCGIGLLCLCESGIRRAGKVDEKTAEINLAQQQSDRRHDNILDQEVTTPPNAAPIIMPTAMSIILPFTANSLNSLNIVLNITASLF